MPFTDLTQWTRDPSTGDYTPSEAFHRFLIHPYGRWFVLRETTPHGDTFCRCQGTLKVCQGFARDLWRKTTITIDSKLIPSIEFRYVGDGVWQCSNDRFEVFRTEQGTFELCEGLLNDAEQCQFHTGLSSAEEAMQLALAILEREHSESLPINVCDPIDLTNVDTSDEDE